jgi:hypothetical protein
VKTFSSSHAVRVGVCGIITVLALILLPVGPARAQVATGSISGTTIDPSGAVVPGVQIRVINTGTGSISTTTSDGAGLFRVSELPIGTYSLEITKEGFSKLVLNNVNVTAGADHGMGEVRLAVGASSVTVEVTEAPPLLETTEAQVTTTFTTQQITSFAGLQENEGMDSLALQLPGVNNTRDNTFSNSNGPGFSVDGIRGRNNDQQIDGQNNNDNSVAGPSLFLSNPDFVQEYQVTTNNFGAEYGRNSGSVVNLVTPSGTNTWHGTISGAEGNSALNTLTNVDKAPFVTPSLTQVPWFNNVFASTTVGGPVKKDHVFVFGGFDTQIIEQHSLDQTGSLTPTPAGLGQLAACYPNSTSVQALRTFGPYGIGGGNPIPSGTVTPLTLTGSSTDPSCTVDFAGVQRTLGTPSHEYDFIGRSDFQYGNDRVYLRYIYGYTNSIDADPFGTAAAGYPASVPSRSQNALIGWTHTLSPSMTNEFRVGYGRQNTEFGGNGIGNTVPVQGEIGNALSSIAVTNTGGPAILTYGVNDAAPQGRVVNNYQVQDQWSYVHGKSQWKAGVNFTYQKSPNVFLPNFNGTYDFAAFTNSGAANVVTPDCTITPGESLSAFSAYACNVPNHISITQGSPVVPFTEKDTFLYVGNDYKLKPNLTINLGLTWSYYGQPANLFHNITTTQQASSTPFWDPALPTAVTTFPSIPAPKNSWGPSVGFAWSPNWNNFLTGKNGSTVVRGGYRLSYDPPFYNIYLNIASSAPVVLAQTLTGATATGNPLLADPVGTAVRAQLAPSLVTGVSDPRSFNETTLTPNFGPDRVHSWSFGIQRQLSPAAAVEVRYVGNHGQNLFQSINENPFIADLAAEFPSFVPSGDTPCPTASAVVPTAVGRVDCNQGIVRQRTNTGYSDYEGLQIQFRANNLAKQLTMTANYTWSKTTDNVSEIFSTFGGGNSNAFSQDPLNFTSAEHGLSGLNIPQAFSLNAFEQLPFFRSQPGLLGRLLGGWGLSGNYILSSGEPYTPIQFANSTFSGGVGSDTPFDNAFIGTFETARPFLGSSSAPVSQVGVFAADGCSLFGGPSCALAPNSLVSLNVLNQTQGATATPVTTADVRFIQNGGEAQSVFGTPFGNAGRNILKDGITNIANFSVIKTFKINERANAQFRATMLNVFNHSNYETVDPFIDDAGLSSFETGFGVPSLSPNNGNGNGFGRRQVFFGVKLNF